MGPLGVCKRRISRHVFVFIVRSGFGVSDVDLVCDQMKSSGISSVGEPYIGYKDWRIAYLAECLPGGGRMHIIDADAE